MLGGVVGTVAAGTLKYDALHRPGALPMIMVGLIEESAKLVVPLVVLLITRYRDPRAGVIVGVASGMGFPTLETMGYGFNALLSSGSLARVEQTLLLRALLSPGRARRLDRPHSSRASGRCVRTAQRPCGRPTARNHPA